ncbi:MAG: hypothetical protein J6J36_06335 [Clostridia bacterium]|nr:hypothetical protein [Clostridia bacterium]
MLKSFFKKLIDVKIDNRALNFEFEKLAEAAYYLSRNTRSYDKLNANDVKSFRKLFKELELLFEYTCTISSYVNPTFFQKVSCIREILHKNEVGIHCSAEDYKDYENCRDGMIFQNYENLWRVVHRINTEWDELCSRGFKLQLFNDFWKSFKYDRSCGKEKGEKEKFEEFMGLLDGKMKFVTIYEKVPVGFTIVEADFKENEIVNTIVNKYNEPYGMCMKE